MSAIVDINLHKASTSEMHGHAPSGAKDIWLFNAEAVSTLLISAWYVFGIFIALGVIPENGFRIWGANWVIPFLLSIFYLGSGYLYQKYQNINSPGAWAQYIKRETIVLLVPFFAFTLLTLAAASLISTQPQIYELKVVEPALTFSFLNILHAIFIHPVGPVGYFVVLLAFMIFAFTPKSKRSMFVYLGLSIGIKILAIVLTDLGFAEHIPYYLMQIMDNWIWFVFGVALKYFDLDKMLSRGVVSVVSSILFVGGGALLFVFGVREAACLMLLTLAGLACFFSLSSFRFTRAPQDKFFGFVTQYTMAIWLMHQILSEVVFCALFAVGISSLGAFGSIGFDGSWVLIWAICTLIACYVLPVLVMSILNRIWKLGFIVYPSRYLPKSL